MSGNFIEEIKRNFESGPYTELSDVCLSHRNEKAFSCIWKFRVLW